MTRMTLKLRRFRRWKTQKLKPQRGLRNQSHDGRPLHGHGRGDEGLQANEGSVDVDDRGLHRKDRRKVEKGSRKSCERGVPGNLCLWPNTHIYKKRLQVDRKMIRKQYTSLYCVSCYISMRYLRILEHWN